MIYRKEYDVEGIRTARNLSRKRFAALLGVSPRAVFDWERGNRSPRWMHLERIEQFIARQQPTFQHDGQR